MCINLWGKRVTFTLADLKAAGIEPELLTSFIFDDREASSLMQENHQESSLHSKPLLRFGDVFVMALPTAVAYAIRRYLVQCAYDDNQLLALQDSFMGQVRKIAMRAMRGGSRHGVKQISLPQAVANCEGKHQNFVFQLGRRRFIHLCILTESFKEIITDGLSGPTEFSDEEEDAIHHYLDELYAYISTSFEVHSGHTLMLFGHLGQGFSFSQPPKRDNWTFDVCRADSLEMLSQDSDHPLDKLVLLLEQRTEMTSNNLHLVNSGGILNLYAFWKESQCCLRTTEMPHDKNCMMQISTDYVFAFRQARRKATDFHCERSVLGKPVSVVRGNTNSLFAAVKEIPAYVSLTHRDAGHLSFCLQQMETTVWLTVLPNIADKHVFAILLDLWEALQFLLFRVLQVVKPQFDITTKAVELLLDMRGLTTVQAAKDDLALSTEMVVKLHRDLPIVKLVAGAGFLRHFSGVENAGEQKLLSRIIYALGLLSGQDDMSEADCDRDALSILGGHDAKILHSVEYYNPVEHLLAAATRSTFRLPQEYQGATIRSVFCWMPASDKKRLLDRDQSIC
jgi:hypothetical protein